MSAVLVQKAANGFIIGPFDGATQMNVLNIGVFRHLDHEAMAFVIKTLGEDPPMPAPAVAEAVREVREILREEPLPKQSEADQEFERVLNAEMAAALKDEPF